MAWGIGPDELEAGRDEMRALAAERASHHVLEQLARAHRWLDDDEAARRRFRQAAADLEARGRGDASSRGRTGGLLRQAGEEEAARTWFERALGSLDVASPRDANRVAPLRYLLGDPEGALVAAALAEEPDPILEPIVELARARRDRDPEAAVRARDGLFRIDTRPGIELTVRLIKEYGEYRVRIEWGDDEEGWYEQDLDHRTPGFRTGVDAAADWLLAYAPDPPGGEGAAETLRALAAAAYE